MLVAIALVGACHSNESKRVVLDGRPRFPDAEGVVTSVTASRITLAGGKTYKVSKTLQCFSTSSLQTVPLLQRQGQYVQVGVSGDTVTWLAAVAAVTPLDPPAVLYNGTLVHVDGNHRAIFRDGTVLRLDGSVSAPAGTGFMRAEIDPTSHLVRKLVLP